MKCDTCQQESPTVMRVVVAKDYNRILARPVYNCPTCFEKKEREKSKDALVARGDAEPGPLRPPGQPTGVG